MGTGYTRNDTSNNIADGNIINAADLDGEFDAIESAMGTSGHTHDGTSAEGGPVTVLGPVQDFVASATEIKPKTTNTLDIGTSGLLFKDMFLDGVATVGSIKIDNAGTIGTTTTGDAITISSGGIVTFKDDIIVKDGGTIGVTSAVDAMTVSSAGIVTFKDDIIIKDGGTIGSASDADAIAISSGGVVTFSQAVSNLGNITGKTSSGFVLALQTSDTTIEATNVLGKIEFSAPDEASGTDAILVGASIEALAEDTFDSSTNSTALVFKTNTTGAATERMRLTSAGDLHFLDDRKAIFGAGSDLQIYHDGSNSIIEDVGDGYLDIKTNGQYILLRNTDGNNLAYFETGGGSHLYWNGVSGLGRKLQTTSTGVDITGTLTSDGLTVDGNILLQSEGNEVQFNTSGSPINKIYTDDTYTTNGLTIEADTGVTLKSTSNYLLLDDSGTNEMVLNVDGGERMRVTSTGVDITGTLTVNDFASLSSTTLTIGGEGGANGVINSDESIYLNIDSNNNETGKVFRVGTDSTSTGGKSIALFSDNGDISFYEDTGTTAKFFWDASEESLGIGTTSPDYQIDIEASSPTARLNSTVNNGVNTIWFGHSDDADAGAIRYWGSAAGLGTYANAMTFNTNGSQAMHIDSSGNVGIGTDLPSANLNISATYSSDTTEQLRIEDNTGSKLDFFGYANGDKGIQAYADNGSNFYNLNLNPLGGDVDIGSTGGAGSGNVILSMAGGVGTQNGTEAAPTHTFYSDPDTGMYRAATNTLGFSTGGSEAMRIDSSGNLLISGTNTTPNLNSAGTTADNEMALRNDGLALFSAYKSTANDGVVMDINRTSTDGGILGFRKDGSTVGSIGVEGGDLVIGTGTNCGLQFNDGNTAIRPFNMASNAPVDAAVDLGVSGTRFKDLYLSGGVYLGGTGSANLLDDYEEGTFTPTIANLTNLTGTASITRAIYTKVGNLCTIQVKINGLTISSSATDTFFSATLPTAAAMDIASDPAITGVARATSFAATGVVVNYTNGNSTQVSVQFPAETVGSSGAFDITYNLTYRTA